MISIKTMSSAEQTMSYLLSEYTTENGESPGHWYGTFSRNLGLEGTVVEKDAFLKLLRGFSTDGRSLCQNSGDKHRPGWDMTFSAPKSVSVLWSSAPVGLRNYIEAAQTQAVLKAMSYMEATSAIVREGKGGVIQSNANIVFATFNHSNNRNGDPQLHTHTIVMNVAQKKGEPKTLTLEGKRFFEAKMAASAVYKVELARSMQDLGFEIKRTDDSFEVSFVPKEIIDFRSSRSNEINAALQEKGLDRESATSALKESVSLSSRAKKSAKPRDFKTWVKEHEEKGFTREHISKNRHNKSVAPQLTVESIENTGKSSVDAISHMKSVFTQHDITKQVLEDLIGKSDSASGFKTIRSLLEKDELLQIEGEKHRYFSTPSMVALEKQIIKFLSDKTERHVLDHSKYNVGGFSFKPDQKKAFLDITRSKENMSILQGVAGSGKSYLMKGIKEAYESNGYKIIGVAPSNKAAKELQGSSGIKCRSLDSLFFCTLSLNVPLPDKLVLIADEAGMMDSRRMVLLQQIAASKNAKLILVGDEKQIQPIMAGRAFSDLKDRTAFSKLTHIFRQKVPEEAQAILSVREGKPQEMIDYLEKKKRLFIKNKNDLKLDLINEWEKRSDVSNGIFHKHVIVSSTNKAVDELNKDIRDAIKAKSGLLKKDIPVLTHRGKEENFSVGDLVIFCETQKKLNIFSGVTGYIKNITNKSATINIIVNEEISDQELKIDFDEYNHLRHAYAITAHKSQASTHDSSLTFIDSNFFDKEKAYVGLSRGRANNLLFVPKEVIAPFEVDPIEKGSTVKEREQKEAAEERKNLLKILSKSDVKETTLQHKGWKKVPERTAEEISAAAWKTVEGKLDSKNRIESKQKTQKKYQDL